MSTSERPDTDLYTSLVSRRIGSSPRILRHLAVFGTLIFLLLGFSAYTNLVTPDERSMRVCVPLDLTKISHASHRAFSCLNSTSTTTSASIMGVKTPFADATEAGFEPGRLAEFLKEQKETFLEDLRRGRSGNWTIAMGNEAGGESWRATITSPFNTEISEPLCGALQTRTRWPPLSPMRRSTLNSTTNAPSH